MSDRATPSGTVPSEAAHADAALFDPLRVAGSQLLRRVFDHAEEHRLQVLVTEVPKAESAGSASAQAPLRRHGFRVDAEYFYPASTVKLAIAGAALAAMERLAAAGVAPIGIDTPLRFHPVFEDEQIEEHDASDTERGCISLGHEVRKVMLVSDNPASNRLFTFVGHREVNEMLWTAGFPSARINHRLEVARTPEQNRRTGRVDLLDAPQGTTITHIPERTSELCRDNMGVPGLEVGHTHVVSGKVLARPMSFLQKNRMSLLDLQNLLLSIARPDLPLDVPGVQFSPANRALLVEAMTEFPARSRNPRYDAAAYPDHFAKPLLPGLRAQLGAGVSVTSKVGQAWGFTIENALVRHERLRVDLAVTATIYANSRGVLGDDSYDDKTIAEPFMADLGAALARVYSRLGTGGVARVTPLTP